MKRIYLSITVLLCSIHVIAQQEYFIFIQHPARQPFYVRMGEDSHSSSAMGHIILSRLKDSVYNLYIGFPKSRAGEQQFLIAMNRKDHGYELRNTDGRWQLYDLQTLQLIDPVSSYRVSAQAVRKTDDYSELMAGVVDDSAVLYTTAEDTLDKSAQAMIKTDSLEKTISVMNNADTVGKAGKETFKEYMNKKLQSAVKADSAEKETIVTVKAENEKTDAAEIINDVPEIDSTAVKKPMESSIPSTELPVVENRDRRDIIRLRTENIAEGKLLIYVDRTGPVSDTIRIIIPRRK